ncbi:MAG: type II toxin-antitoxin system RelE/ParE family toxin [Methylacidiphilales bacterium]|nr:type II toxin-antitoxin system RelE/ParE family toxin [Candidatus Methylacidiphilales bacterium]
MLEYQITFARSARKELEKLPPHIAERILGKIEDLSATPRPGGSLKLKGGRNLWRIRIGDYRVIYEIDDGKGIIDISIIRHRREVYRDL